MFCKFRLVHLVRVISEMGYLLNERTWPADNEWVLLSRNEVESSLLFVAAAIVSVFVPAPYPENSNP